jgi:DNA-binding HxlR family transcriptional regulator
MLDEECHNEGSHENGRCGQAALLMRGARLLQEKWVLMIVFSLLDGPLSFCDLMRRGTINTTTLTQRLHLLEEAGLLTKTVHSAMPPRTSYALTEGGLALRPILDAIAEWSGLYLSPL